MIEVLQATGAYGVRGLVRATLISDRISCYSHVYDVFGREFCFKIVKFIARRAVVLALGGINDRTAAMALKNASFYIKRSVLPDPDDGEFYFCDLIGCGIVLVDEQNTAVAPSIAGINNHKITNVYNFGAGDLLEISDSDGEAFFVPFTRENFPPLKTVSQDNCASPNESINNSIIMTLNAFNWYRIDGTKKNTRQR
ncbi:MAG: ribosome maturation factor RimM [Holosporaceae bacterium]|nr:ribosome maturation factor RimM [Holosporaceae bacterium]